MSNTKQSVSEDIPSIIIQHCHELMSMAKEEQWDGFEKKLYERDVLINQVYHKIDMSQLTPIEQKQFFTIKSLNDDIKSIVIEKQNAIQSNLLAESQRDKARQAYQQGSR